jgi:hypothetical protein
MGSEVLAPNRTHVSRPRISGCCSNKQTGAGIESLMKGATSVRVRCFILPDRSASRRAAWKYSVADSTNLELAFQTGNRRSILCEGADFSMDQIDAGKIVGIDMPLETPVRSFTSNLKLSYYPSL